MGISFHSNNFNVNGATVQKQQRVLADGEVENRLKVNGKVVNPWHDAPQQPAPAGDTNATTAAATALAAPPAGGIPALPPAAAVDPAGGGDPTDPTAAPDPLNFASTGDPHDVATNGATFDNEKVGVFQAVSTDGSFGIQQTQKHCENIPGLSQYAGATANTALDIKTSPDNFVRFNATTQHLRIDGQLTPLPTAGQSIDLPGGGTLTGNQDGTLTVTSSQGDTVNITNNQGPGPNGTQGYLDFTGTVSPTRDPSTVHGLLGPNGGNNPLGDYRVTDPNNRWSSRDI